MRTMTTTMMVMMMMAAALALAACGGKSSSKAISNSGGGGEAARTVSTTPGFRDGALWSCQISDYDPQPCKLQETGGGWELRKLMGSQRFIGGVVEESGGLRFSGRFFCPWGACDATMEVTFGREGDGYLGTFEGDEIRLRYDEALEAEYGGAGYGGLTGEETE